MKDRTALLVSHRVSTIRGAEKIIVLEKGRIAEEGSHSELIKRGGYYFELWNKQMLREELEIE